MTADTRYSGPLAGLTVLDFGHYYAGPLAGMLLADQGATVIRIVRPGARELPEAQYRVLNRNKQLLTLDLKRDGDRARALELAAAADVLIENFRPGVMDRLGLGWPELKLRNPALVYLSLPGFSAVDAARAGVQAWEGVLCAATSLYAMDMLRNKFGFPPHYMSVAPCSTFGAMHGAVAVLAALHARRESGLGTFIEAPLAAAGLSTCARSFVYRGEKIRTGFDTLSRKPLPESARTMAYDCAEPLEVAAEKLANIYNFIPRNFVTNAYRSRDNRLMMFMPIKPEMAQRFFDRFGLIGQLLDEGFVFHSPWQSPEQEGIKNLANAWELGEHNRKIIERIQAIVGAMSADECQQAMLETRIPFAYVRTRREWLNIAELLQAGMFVDMGQGDQRLRTVGRVVDVSGPRGEIMPVGAEAFREAEPVCREALSTVLAGGNKAPRPGREAAKHELLRGLKVLDLCNVVAGPNAAYTLAQYGAEVIRVEPPDSFNLPMHLGWTLEVNQGKRSMVLDIKTPAGREVFERLVAQSDVVLHNRLDDVATRLGMNNGQLKAINPKVIACQVSAFGASLPGAWEQLPGYDPNPNMCSGLEAARGTPESPSAMMEIFSDLMGGLSLAFSAVLALYQRDATGAVGSGYGSLARGCNYYQMPQLIDGDSVTVNRRGEGWFALGESAAQRLYACADDRWVYVGARPGDEHRLATLVAGRADAAEQALEQSFRAHDADHWYRLLNNADIGCYPVVDIDELCHARLPRRVGNSEESLSTTETLDIVCFEQHPCGIPLVLPLPSWVRCGEERSYRKLATTPKVGQHTREILQELGYGDADIASLYAARIAWDYLPAIGNQDDYFFVQRKVLADANSTGRRP